MSHARACVCSTCGRLVTRDLAEKETGTFGLRIKDNGNGDGSETMTPVMTAITIIYRLAQLRD